MSDQSFQSLLAERAEAPYLRQAAALIHALGPSDRRWAIDQMPAPQRPSLHALLEELESLGMPRERAIVDEVLRDRAAGAPQAVRSDAPDFDAAQGIDRWVSSHGAAALARSLVDEPVGLIARLLTLRDWAWRPDVLRQLQPALRHDVVEAMRLCSERDGSSTRADAVLLGLFARRLEGLRLTGDPGPAEARSFNPPKGSSSPFWQRLWSRWRATRSGA